MSIEDTLRSIENNWQEIDPNKSYVAMVGVDPVKGSISLADMRALTLAYREQAAVTRVVEDYLKVAQCTCDNDTTCWKHLFEYNLNFLAAAVRRGENS
jgi:hypothetical protein